MARGDGACCLDNDNCLVLTEAECDLIASSSWAGPATDCADLNADSLPDACFPPPPDGFEECFLHELTAADATLNSLPGLRYL